MRELSKVSDALENVKNRVLLVKNENDRLINQMKEQQDHALEEQTIREHKNALGMLPFFEVECANLNQELQDMEAPARREQKKPPEEANQKIQVWQEEVERAHQGQRDAESKLSTLEKLELMKEKIKVDKEKLEVRKLEVEGRKIDTEMKIMAIDTSSMSYEEKEYYSKLKMKILQGEM